MAGDIAHAIISVTVEGFKSIEEETRIEIRPLTILAGANSSGKSTAIQPLLLLKQTLESNYDSGPLLLNGPNVRFTSWDQLVTKTTRKQSTRSFKFQVDFGDSTSVRTTFTAMPGHEFQISETTYRLKENESVVLRPDMTASQVAPALPVSLTSLRLWMALENDPGFVWGVYRNRCFLDIGLRAAEAENRQLMSPVFPDIMSFRIAYIIRGVTHVPGLRGNPSRIYPTSNAVVGAFPGTFENYVASVVNHWHVTKSPLLNMLSGMLQELGLTWTIQPRPIDDTQIDPLVGRLPRAKRGGDRDLVSVADVGIGVSQILPVLVALLAASPGQLVYVEQPEIHLHPRAQEALARILLLTAQRGVRVVVETHSALLVLAVQSLVAEGKASADLVKLHWFNRGPSGATAVTSAHLDEAGAFGDWPEDFGDVELDLQRRYLAAAGSHQRIGA